MTQTNQGSGSTGLDPGIRFRNPLDICSPQNSFASIATNVGRSSMAKNRRCLATQMTSRAIGREQREQRGRLSPQLLASGGGAPATLMQICSEYTYVVSNFYR